MPYLMEVVEKKNILDRKIAELTYILKVNQDNDLAKKLFSLVEERQSVILNIRAANNVSTINIGGKDVSIATAVEIRKTIKSKIDILTKLIEDENCGLNKIELQSQRDSFYEEYVLLTMGINRNDLQVKVN
jgi:hypothetical protein